MKIPTLYQMLKEENVRIIFCTFETKEIIGYIEYNDMLRDTYPDQPLMLISNDASEEEQRYAIAVLLGCYKSYFEADDVWFNFCLTDYREIDPDILLYARELLIPYELVKHKEKLREDLFNNSVGLSKHFGVPKKVAFERIKDFDE